VRRNRFGRKGCVVNRDLVNPAVPIKSARWAARQSDVPVAVIATGVLQRSAQGERRARNAIEVNEPFAAGSMKDTSDVVPLAARKGNRRRRVTECIGVIPNDDYPLLSRSEFPAIECRGSRPQFRTLEHAGTKYFDLATRFSRSGHLRKRGRLFT
jgi:hypothetical protein